MTATATWELPVSSRTGRDKVPRVLIQVPVSQRHAGLDASRPRRLRFASGQRTDMVTIPPHTSEEDARAAMRQAAQAGNREHAPAVLAAIRAAASPAAGAATGQGLS